MSHLFTHKGRLVLAAVLSILFFASCSETRQTLTIEHLNVDKNTLMNYVTCPEDTVDLLLAIGDTIFTRSDSLCLESLSMENAEVNAHLDSLYGDTIPMIVSLYATYDALTSRDPNQVNAVFVWHEMVRKQIASFYGKSQATAEDVEHIFGIIEDILECYGCFTQFDMNNAAWRDVMLSDYDLVSSYMCLIDACKGADIRKHVQNAYQNIFDTYYYIHDHSENDYSMFPMEMAYILSSMMEEKQQESDCLINEYKNKQTDIAAIKHALLTSKLSKDKKHYE